jgi:uncharacterized membrane protein YtjA (UPF0391 family)
LGQLRFEKDPSFQELLKRHAYCVSGYTKTQLGPFPTIFTKREVGKMLQWAVTFLVIGLIAGLFGLFGVAGVATQIAWVLFVVFVVLFLVSLVMGRRPPV